MIICKNDDLFLNEEYSFLDEEYYINGNTDEDIITHIGEVYIGKDGNYYINETASHTNAMTLQAAMKWYNKFVKGVSKGARSKEELDARIELLEAAVKNMEAAKKTKPKGEVVRYALGQLIPFNGLYRLIKRGDNTAFTAWGLRILAAIGVGIIAPVAHITTATLTSLNNAIAVGAVVGRGQGYEKMLDDAIADTKEAIKYLKERKKNFK